MNYDPASSNDLRGATTEAPSLARLIVAAALIGLAIGVAWYLTVAIRVGP